MGQIMPDHVDQICLAFGGLVEYVCSPRAKTRRVRRPHTTARRRRRRRRDDMSESCAPRHIYIDVSHGARLLNRSPSMHSRIIIPLANLFVQFRRTQLGVNWANTARLFEDIGEREMSYEIYGFEASPLIAPFADQYFAWLNGDRSEEPELCLPRSGSTYHLAGYAAAFGCATSTHRHDTAAAKAQMRECMWKRLELPLAALQSDPRLNDSALIGDRMDRARQRRCQPRLRHNLYTFIPAAVGSTNEPWLDFYGPPRALIRGGSVSSDVATRHYDKKTGKPDPGVHLMTYDFHVRSVNFPEWFDRSFSERDYVILKIDVEGAEHAILREMVRRRMMPKVDVLSMECHNLLNTTGCTALHRHVQSAAPRMRMMREGSPTQGNSTHFGSDSHSGVPAAETLAKLVSSCEAKGLLSARTRQGQLQYGATGAQQL